MREALQNYTDRIDLASRALGGAVVSASDELFAEKENLINPAASVEVTGFGHKGGLYDGWETRRRREPGHDYAIVRLGVPGVIHGVVIDTSWFTGNYPPLASVEAASLEGWPSREDLERAAWETIVEKASLKGDAGNEFHVTDTRRFTHVRLNIFPDGGVARFRVHGDPVPDPRLFTTTIDLAAIENGGAVVDVSNRFYSTPSNVLQPGRANKMGDGWETARRRDDGNDYLIVRLGLPGVVELVEVDTSYFVGNAPAWVSLKGADSRAASLEDASEWTELVGATRVQPDTRHYFRPGSEREVTHVRLEIYPDGGLSRLRINGTLTNETRSEAIGRWLDLLPEVHAVQVLVDAGESEDAAKLLVKARPFIGASSIPKAVRDALLR
jgi:allantoicase